jgi:hypothetical protein
VACPYSTPRARPSPSVRTFTTRQCVFRSRLPVASASGTEVMPACQRSLLMGPKPRLRALYFVSGYPLYGLLFTPAGNAWGCNPIAAAVLWKSWVMRVGLSGGKGYLFLRGMKGLSSSPPAMPISSSSSA